MLAIHGSTCQEPETHLSKNKGSQEKKCRAGDACCCTFRCSILQHMHAMIDDTPRAEARAEVSQYGKMSHQSWHSMVKSKCATFFQRTWNLAGVISLSTAVRTSATVSTKGSIKAQER